MQVKIIAEYSATLSTFKSYHLSLRPLFCLFLVAVLDRFFCIFKLNEIFDIYSGIELTVNDLKF